MDLLALIYKWQQKGIHVLNWKDFLDTIKNKISIAIVGNAGYLTEIKQGSKIDSYDIVIRMNNFCIYGFEEMLGSKVDIFFTNFGGSIKYQAEVQQAKYILASRPNHFFKTKHRAFAHRKGKHLTTGMKKMQRDTVYAPSLEYYSHWIEKLDITPTTGFMAIVFVLDCLKSRLDKVYITGFSFFQDKSHYFSNQHVDPEGYHDVEREKNYLKTLFIPLIENKILELDEKMYDYLFIK